MEGSFEFNELTWRDYWAMAVRRRWWLMGPTFLLGLLGVAAAHIWPELYRSEALILVEQQIVPQQYVVPNVNTSLQDRIQSMTQQILSRSRLRRLIEQYNLYTRERTRKTIDEVIDKMRERVHLELVESPGRPGELTAFRISFTSGSPRIAQQITNELTSLFIEQNLEERTQQSVSTTNFLANQLDEGRKDLAEQEEKLRGFKSRYLGQLPEQQQTNLQILSSLEAQLQASVNALERDEQERIYLESVRAGYQAMERTLGASGPPPQSSPEAVLRDLRKQLTELEAKYTPHHPDILKLKQEIAHWEALEQRSQAKTGGSEASEGNRSGASAGADPSAIEVESRLKALALQINNHQRDIDLLRQRIREAQARLNLAPLREQQLSEITRNYENSRDYYKSLLQKKMQSELATNLEKRQQGEQFRIIDPASLPRKPAEPNRVQIVVVGWLLGLCSGVGLAALREVTDDRLRSETDVIRSTKLLVLVRLPVLRTPREEALLPWFRTLEAAGVTLLALISIGAGVYTCLKG